MANPKTIKRIEATIQRRAAHCLQFEVSDPRASFITITAVELSSDLASAKISYSVLGDSSEKSKTQAMLEHANGFIQRQVASVLRLRRAPRLRWEFDNSIEEAARLARLIREARERDAEIRGEPAGSDPEDDLDSRDSATERGDSTQE